MIYPPPPGLAFIAYAYGNISKEELEYCLKLWKEKHKEDKK